MLFQPVGDESAPPSVRLFDCSSEQEFSEAQYFQFLLALFNQRNPHALIEALDEGEDEPAEDE